MKKKTAVLVGRRSNRSSKQIPENAPADPDPAGQELSTEITFHHFWLLLIGCLKNQDRGLKSSSFPLRSSVTKPGFTTPRPAGFPCASESRTGAELSPSARLRA